MKSLGPIIAFLVAFLGLNAAGWQSGTEVFGLDAGELKAPLAASAAFSWQRIQAVLIGWWAWLKRVFGIATKRIGEYEDAIDPDDHKSIVAAIQKLNQRLEQLEKPAEAQS